MKGFVLVDEPESFKATSSDIISLEDDESKVEEGKDRAVEDAASVTLPANDGCLKMEKGRGEKLCTVRRWLTRTNRNMSIAI